MHLEDLDVAADPVSYDMRERAVLYGLRDLFDIAIGSANGTVRLTIKARPRSYTAAMPTARDPLYQRHRFPPEVISHAVWLYFRFPLSLRMVEELLAARGICVTYETVRQWGKKFGKAFADQIRQRAPCSRR